MIDREVTAVGLAPACFGQHVQQLQHIQVQQVEEHRRRADVGQWRQRPGHARLFVQAQQQQADAQGQQQEQQRGRVLGHVEEAHQRIAQRGQGLPRAVAVSVDRPQQHEGEQRTGTGQPQPTLAQEGIAAACEPRADHPAQCNHADPRQHRIRGPQAQPVGHRDPVALVQHFPQHGQRPVTLHPDAIEQVVPGDHGQRQHRQRAAREPEQPGQRDHADADCPDHLQVHDARWELQRPGEVDHQQFQHHQEQAALEQEGRGGPAPIRFAAGVQPGRQAGQQHEHRGTQMRQQPADEQGRLHLVHRHRVGHLGMQVKGFAHVVEQHQHDHGAAQLVDGGQAGGGGMRHSGAGYSVR